MKLRSTENESWNCPICRGESVRRFEVHGIGIRDCLRCRHRFAEYRPSTNHVDAVYGEEYFSGGGAGYSDYLSEQRLVRQHGRWFAKKLRRWFHPGDYLDVGAAAGFIMQGWKSAGWKCTGVEPNGPMADFARSKLGLNVCHSAWENFQTGSRFDLIGMIQVLPHFADSLGAIQKSASLLKPNGGILIETWNSESLSARLLGSAWHEYSPPSVLHWFAPNRLRALMRQLGFVELSRGRPPKWIEAGHASSLLKYKLASSSLLGAMTTVTQLIPDKLPIPYPAEDLFWAVYRKV